MTVVLCKAIGPYPGHGANVVLVAVGDDDRLDLGAPAMQEAGVRKDLLHAQVREAAQQKYAAVSVSPIQQNPQYLDYFWESAPGMMPWQLAPMRWLNSCCLC